MKDSYIGENIRFYRERANFTQQDLADRVGVTWEMISRYERNASSALNKLDRISKALNVSQSQLLEEHIPENVSRSNFRIPLITNNDFKRWFDDSSKIFYYSAPEWIFQNNIEAVAVDGDLINSIDDSTSIYYVIKPTNIKSKDWILVINGKDIIEEKYDRQSYKSVIGKIIGKEIKY